jgi:hypothetical protein
MPLLLHPVNLQGTPCAPCFQHRGEGCCAARWVQPRWWLHSGDLLVLGGAFVVVGCLSSEEEDDDAASSSAASSSSLLVGEMRITVLVTIVLLFAININSKR